MINYMVVWSSVVGYEGIYDASDAGKIYSYKSDKILSGTPTAGGYIKVCVIDINGTTKSKFVHQLVALSFLKKPVSDKKLVVDHINGKRDDNRLKNLRWITHSGNSKHAHEINPNMQNNNNRVQKFDENEKVVAEYKSVREASRVTLINRNVLKKLLKNNKIHEGFIYRCVEKVKQKEIVLGKHEKTKILGLYRGHTFSNYKVSTRGKIFSIKSQRCLKPCLTEGYYTLRLIGDNGEILTASIHVLVAFCFVKPPADFEDIGKKYVVNHKDEIKTNNYYKNLQWMTRQSNTAYSLGKAVKQIDKDTNEVLNIFKSIKDACDFLDVPRSNYGPTIGQCCAGKKNVKTCRGYKWEFVE